MKNNKPKYQLFGSPGSEEHAMLEKDILERGIQVPIEFDDKGQILDGHTRLEIAKKHKLDFPKVIRKFKTEEEKIAHVLMLNMARRHLKAHEWGAAFKRLLEVRGVNSKPGPKKDSATVALIAEEIGVPRRTAFQRMEQAEQYQKLPAVEKEAVDRGAKSIASAARKAEQGRKREEAAQTAEIEGKFSVIYADPPWQYGASTVTGGADRHYATQPTKEIGKLDVRRFTTENAVLFLWVTNPLLPDGLEVIGSWGFNYKTNLVWVKDKETAGLGEYVRGKHELLLIATRGSFIPEKTLRPSSAIESPREKHSSKPEKVYSLIEKMYPDQKYLELYARAKRKGWTSYGAEIHQAAQEN